MCGIAAYVGPRDAVAVVMEELRRLEYRGYDSAGVATLTPHVEVVKSSGKLKSLEELLKHRRPLGRVAVAHTRWATHGGPTTPNAHPHTDCSGDLVVCHNGIIENHAELRSWLEERGHRFQSETDTEVLPHLVEEYYAGDLAAAVNRAIERVRGSYAVAVMSRQDPDLLVVARHDSPLVIGMGEGETFVASDIPALLPFTRRVIVLEDGDLALLRPAGVEIRRHGVPVVEPPVLEVEWEIEAAERGGYSHFMLKEIHEQPQAVRRTLAGRLRDNRVVLNELDGMTPPEGGWDRIYVIGCGTAYHAGLAFAQIWERRMGCPITVEVASEFRYREPLIEPRTLVIAISQSGETADTLAAGRLAREQGATVVAVVNVVGSSLARESRWAVYTQAGPEISVASTKAYTCQLVTLGLLGVALTHLLGRPVPDEDRWCAAAAGLPEAIHSVLAREAELLHVAELVVDCRDFFFLGRGLDHAVAQEGALKLKEISYRHSEALAAGEMKHGTLALVTEAVTAIVPATQPHLWSKLASNIREVRSRGASVLALAPAGAEDVKSAADWFIELPETLPEWMPVLAILPLQLLAYHTARIAGCEIDQPRNLAKSVTVE